VQSAVAFLDSGSTDGTVEPVKSQENVTVLRTNLPYQEYEPLYRRYLGAQRTSFETHSKAKTGTIRCSVRLAPLPIAVRAVLTERRHAFATP